MYEFNFIIPPWLGLLATGAMLLWAAAILVMIMMQLTNKNNHNDKENEGVSYESDLDNLQEDA